MHAYQSKKELLNTKEAAEFLGMGVSSVEQDRIYGRLKIPFTRIGRSIRYRRSDLEAFVSSLPTFTSTSAADEASHGRA